MAIDKLVYAEDDAINLVVLPDEIPRTFKLHSLDAIEPLDKVQVLGLTVAILVSATVKLIT